MIALASSGGNCSTTSTTKAVDPQAVVQGEIDRARTAISVANKELAKIANNVNTYGSAKEMEARQAKLVAKSRAAKIDMDSLERLLFVLRTASDTQCATDEQRKKFLCDKEYEITLATEDLETKTARYNAAQKELDSIKEAAVCLSNKTKYTNVQTEHTKVLKRFERMKACDSGELLLGFAPVGHSDTTESEKRAIQTAANALNGGDTTRICRVVSTIDDSCVGYACYSNGSVTASAIPKKTKVDGGRKKIALDADDSSVTSYVESDADDDDDDDGDDVDDKTERATLARDIGMAPRSAPHIDSVLMAHQVCISADNDPTSRPIILLAQQRHLIDEVFGIHGFNTSYHMKLDVMRMKIGHYISSRKYTFAWIACPLGDTCKFCRGVDLNFDCVSKATLAKTNWQRLERYGGGRNPKFAKSLTEARRLAGHAKSRSSSGGGAVATVTRKRHH